MRWHLCMRSQIFQARASRHEEISTTNESYKRTKSLEHNRSVSGRDSHDTLPVSSIVSARTKRVDLIVKCAKTRRVQPCLLNEFELAFDVSVQTHEHHA